MPLTEEEVEQWRQDRAAQAESLQELRTELAALKGSQVTPANLAELQSSITGLAETAVTAEERAELKQLRADLAELKKSAVKPEGPPAPAPNDPPTNQPPPYKPTRAQKLGFI